MKLTLIRTARETGKETFSTWPSDTLMEKMKTENKAGHISALRSLIPHITGSNGHYPCIDKLPRICPAAEYARSKEGERYLKTYNGLVQIEVNHLANAVEVEQVKRQAALLPQTFAAFCGSSGRSVKIWVLFATPDGSRPRRIAFLHCVGSRDEKVCQQHCSKVCCITGVKQAMEMRQMFPEADVFNFYMDIRMFGPGYEEMYREAQQKYNIHFIRGRISEASPMIDGRVQIKAEDTLTGRPLRMSVDMLILIVGMRANDDNAAFAEGAGLNRAPSGFMAPRDMFLGNVKSNVEGIFYAGTVTAPKNIGESLNEGTAAADAAARYVGV